MQTVMDFTFDTEVDCGKWYSSFDPPTTHQLVPPALAAPGIAEIHFNPNMPDRKLWWDANHVHFGFINLLLVSWFGGESSDPAGGGIGRAWEHVPDLSNAEVIFTVKAVDVYLPDSARLGLWYQARIPDVAPEGPVQHVYANYFQHVDLLDDVLGFGGRGFARPKTTWGVRSTGWRDWKVRMCPDDDMWTAMGSRLSKTAISYQPQTNNFAYGAAASVKDMLSAPIKANMGIIATWKPTPDLNTAPYPVCPMLGRIYVKRVRILVPD